MRGRRHRSRAIQSGTFRSFRQRRQSVISVARRMRGGNGIHLAIRKFEDRPNLLKQTAHAYALSLGNASIKAHRRQPASNAAHRTGHGTRPVNRRSHTRPQIPQRNARCQTDAEPRRRRAASRNFVEHLHHRCRPHRNDQHLGPLDRRLQIARHLHPRFPPQRPQFFPMAVVHKNRLPISSQPQPRC